MHDSRLQTIELVSQKNVELELKSNQVEQERRNGSLVRYGSVVQVPTASQQ